MKRYNIITLLLVIYLAVMAYFGRGMLLSGNYWEYFSIIVLYLFYGIARNLPFEPFVFLMPR